MKIYTFLLVLLCTTGFAQRSKIDSLKQDLAFAQQDSSKVMSLVELCNLYQYFDLDSAKAYGDQGLALSQKIKFYKGEIQILISLSGALKQQGEVPNSLKLLFHASKLALDRHFPFETAMCLYNIGAIYWSLRDYSKAIKFCKQARTLIETAKNNQKYYDIQFLTNLYIGISYSELNQLDSAFVYLQKNYTLTRSNKTWHPVALTYLGETLFKRGNVDVAFEYLHRAIELNKQNNDANTNADAYKIIAVFFKQTGKADSSIFYGKKGLVDAQKIGYKLGILDISKLLAEQYSIKDSDTAYYYLQVAMSVNDELYGAKKVQDLQKIITDEQERLRQVEIDTMAYHNQSIQLALLTGLGIMFLIGFILYRNNRQKQQSHLELKQQKENVESALTQLKVTQSRLIQAEKMASLGELTAGIAHEIQNPLNFVNNFSEVSTELVEELQQEHQSPSDDIELEAELLNDLKQNLQKITLHGGRAASIVKGMLEHSRSSTGEWEPTNLNALADEYLRLAYQGQLAKDKAFHCDLVTNFDAQLGQVEMVAAEMGRVLLNLCNNAFYAVKEKQKLALIGYQPTITVSTAQVNGHVQIRVSDNGIGMSEGVRAKIFQPFFTTKPTGEGTGLGLSLSYDIVTKSYGGGLTVESQEGEGTEFMIQLIRTNLAHGKR